MEKVIEGLEKLLNFLETDSAAADPKCGEAAEEVRLLLERLKEGDTDILGRLTYLCSPQGDVYRIVSAAGKEEELARLEADIDEAIGDFRLRKTEGGERLMATSYASSPGRLQISDYKWREIARAYRLGIRKKIKVQLAPQCRTGSFTAMPSPPWSCPSRPSSSRRIPTRWTR